MLDGSQLLGGRGLGRTIIRGGGVEGGARRPLRGNGPEVRRGPCLLQGEGTIEGVKIYPGLFRRGRLGGWGGERRGRLGCRGGGGLRLRLWRGDWRGARGEKLELLEEDGGRGDLKGKRGAVVLDGVLHGSQLLRNGSEGSPRLGRTGVQEERLLVVLGSLVEPLQALHCRANSKPKHGICAV